MKSIFDAASRQELITRIHSLNEQSRPLWGRMNVYQMLKHCTLSEEMYQGKKQYKRLFIGRLFGKVALKGILKDEAPMKRNQPTHPGLKITGSGDIAGEKQKWIQLMEQYGHFSNPAFVHPFFGRMSAVEIGRYVYKHTDHHLRQFNC